MGDQYGASRLFGVDQGADDAGLPLSHRRVARDALLRARRPLRVDREEPLGGFPARVHAPRIAFEYFLLFSGTDALVPVDVALGVVVILPRLRIDAAHRTDHL